MDVKAIANKVLGILNLKVCEDKKDTSKEDTQCCENCKKVKELEAEIKELDALVSWIENKAFEYEDEAYRLRKQLNKLLQTESYIAMFENVSPKL